MAGLNSGCRQWQGLREVAGGRGVLNGETGSRNRRGSGVVDLHKISVVGAPAVPPASINLRDKKAGLAMRDDRSAQEKKRKDEAEDRPSAIHWIS